MSEISYLRDVLIREGAKLPLQDAQNIKEIADYSVFPEVQKESILPSFLKTAITATLIFAIGNVVISYISFPILMGNIINAVVLTVLIIGYMIGKQIKSSSNKQPDYIAESPYDSHKHAYSSRCMHNIISRNREGLNLSEQEQKCCLAYFKDRYQKRAEYQVYILHHFFDGLSETIKTDPGFILQLMLCFDDQDTAKAVFGTGQKLATNQDGDSAIHQCYIDQLKTADALAQNILNHRISKEEIQKIYEAIELYIHKLTDKVNLEHPSINVLFITVPNDNLKTISFRTNDVFDLPYSDWLAYDEAYSRLISLCNVLNKLQQYMQ